MKIVDNTDYDDDNVHRPDDVTVSSKNIYQRIQHLDEYAWFIIFLTALSYLIAARSSGGGGPSRGGLFSNLVAPYEVVSTSVMVLGSDGRGGGGGSISENEKVLKSIFYIDDNNSLQGNDGDNSSPTMMLALQRGSQLEVVLSSDLDVNMGGIGNGLIGTHDDKECTASSGIDKCNSSEIDTDNNNDDDKSSKPTQHRQQPSPPPPPRPFLSHLTSTAWVHDPDLGRGYLLINDAGRSGRIWRWEVGGGPISIGKTLHMERSGCRSGLWVEEGSYDGANSPKSTKAGTCPENLKGDLSLSSLSELRMTKSSSLPSLLGSASIAVEPSTVEDGKKNLAVAEWGERRIVRVEEGTGARTPLATLVPIEEEEDNHHDNEDISEQRNRLRRRRRLYRPNHLTYTPTGDLLFSDSFVIEGEGDRSDRRQVGVVYRKKGAVHIPPISVEQSRDAHAWIRTTGKQDDDEDGDDNIEILFQLDGWIEGISLGLDHATLYVLAVADRMDQTGLSKTVYKLRIGAIDDDDDDEEDSEDDTDNKVKEDDASVDVFYETSSSDCNLIDNINSIVRDEPFPSTGSKLAVDKTGTVYLISCPTSVTLLSRQGQMIGALALDHSRGQSPTSSLTTHLTSIGFGEDGYIYITSVNELMRVKSRVGGLSMPGNIILPSSLKP